MNDETTAAAIHIALVDRASDEAYAAKEVVMQKAMQTWASLFEGDRWRNVNCVAVATTTEGAYVGLASLAMKGETGRTGKPEIVGAWVHPDYRGGHVALHLVEACVEEARAHGAHTVCIHGISDAGHALALRAARAVRARYGGLITLEVQSERGFGELP